MTNKILDYTLALVNLYGIIDCSKITEVYNLHHASKLKGEDLKIILSNHRNFLRDHFIEMAEDYLISAEVRVLSNIEKEVEEKKNKPFYIPASKDLLKYKKRTYFEANEAYKDLEEYLKNKIGCIKRSRKLTRGINLRCKSTLVYDKLEPYIKENNLYFDDFHEKSIFLNYVENLERNTRKWSNNGYTQEELESN